MMLEYWVTELEATSLILERSKSSVDLLKGMLGNVIKFVKLFQVAVYSIPVHLWPETLSDSFSSVLGVVHI